MSLSSLLPALIENRMATAGPVRVGLIGAGKFGSMFLAQVPTSPHVRIIAIADLDPDRARRACGLVGWCEDRAAGTRFTDDAAALIADPAMEVVIEATGDPAAGIAHAEAAIAAGKHIVMVNVEADVLAGPLLAAKARKAGVVYAMAHGDQPALVCELVDWARTCGFQVTAAGKGTRYKPGYHGINPDTVWDHYGLTAGEAKLANMNPQMFSSFMDGTKSAIEMAAIANACALSVPDDGLAFPACTVDRLADLLKPKADGGLLQGKGFVEVVSSIAPDGAEDFPGHLRWGVYVVFEAPNDYTAACFRQYGLCTDASGRYGALYRPYHLIGLELGVSVVAAALKGEPTGHSRHWRGDVVAVAKRDLEPGEMLDGEGGFCVWGKLVPAGRSTELDALPIGLAHRVRLRRGVTEGTVLSHGDIDPLPASPAVRARREMVRAFG